VESSRQSLAGYSRHMNEGPGSGGETSSSLERAVHAELLTARKSSDGLSPNSMATLPVMRDLLGDGDPLAAFQRLTHRILETLELGDDVRSLEAATYSLGLGSAGKTHLDRLNDFGQEYGYEVRQVRRYSDRGLRQLARLITSNWIVHTVPTLEVFVAQQPDRSLAVTLRATRQHFVSMHGVQVYEQEGDGARLPVAGSVERHLAAEVPSQQPAPAERIVEELNRPFVLAPAHPGVPRHLRFEWKGEVWPRFALSIVGALAPGYVLTSQTLGNTMQVTVEALAP
jgi:hypothetical protein